jgi:hypothetical protein
MFLTNNPSSTGVVAPDVVNKLQPSSIVEQLLNNKTTGTEPLHKSKALSPEKYNCENVAALGVGIVEPELCVNVGLINVFGSTS